MTNKKTSQYVMDLLFLIKINIENCNLIDILAPNNSLNHYQIIQLKN